IEIDRQSKTSITTVNESKLVKATQSQLRARSRDGLSTEPSPTSIGLTKDTSDYYRKHGVSTNDPSKLPVKQKTDSGDGGNLLSQSIPSPGQQ
ncbi:hypothetical protein A2U01_0013849, partial [Trifolium medium]|nr:hypothetical protein [Trifolium medium]